MLRFISIHPTVVDHPDFYYHLTAIDGIDLPLFAVFCFSRDLSHSLFTTFSARENMGKEGSSCHWNCKYVWIIDDSI